LQSCVPSIIFRAFKIPSPMLSTTQMLSIGCKFDKYSFHSPTRYTVTTSTCVPTRRVPGTSQQLSKSEQNRTSGSKVMPVPSSNPATSCIALVTHTIIDNPVGTQNYDVESSENEPKTPESSKISRAFYSICTDYLPFCSACTLWESTPSPPNPTLPSNSSNEAFDRKISKSSSSSDDQYCTENDTVPKANVVNTEPSCPSTPQWAYRVHNQTDPTKSLAYLGVQHPLPIQGEDLPRSPSEEEAEIGEHC
jgi:hypothetical protein